MKVDPAAGTLGYVTQIGGSANEASTAGNEVGTQQQGVWLTVDDLGQVTLTGWSDSLDFPTTDGSANHGQVDLFVTRLTAAGTGPVYSTLVGGSRIDLACGIAHDPATGRIYVAGNTRSSDFPVPQGLVTRHGGRTDAIVAELDGATGALLRATFLGGSGVDSAWAGVAVDPSGRVCVAGGASRRFEPPPTSTTYTTGDYAARLLFGPQPPTPGIAVVPTAGLVTTEDGDTDTFTVALDTQPTAPVQLDVWTDDPSEGLVSVDALAPATSVTLAFDATTWDQPQTVTVHGQQDPDPDGDVAYTLGTDPAASADPDYAGLDADDVAATNLDDETPPTIAVTDVDPGAMNAGSSAAVTITGAGFQPGAAVTFENGTGPSPQAGDVVVVSSTTITATFTAGGGGLKGIRTWDVRVTNSDGSTGVLAGGFEVIK